MAASTRRDLFISVNGSVTGLAATMKAGKSLVLDFGTDSVNVLEQVEKKLGEVGTGGLPGLKEAEKNFDATFRRIRENARAVLEAPSGQAAVQIVDANATRAAADAAAQKAAAFRLVAEAATRADQAQNGQNAAVRAYAVAAAAAAVEADQESRALREQATILGQVEGQLETTGAAQRRTIQLSGQAKAGYQQLSYQLGDVATQYASGTSATIIFAQQSSQVIQAIQLISGEAKGLLGLLGGPWGLAFSSALVLLTPFVGKLLEGRDALAKETEQLKENAEKAGIAAKAKEAFARSQAGVIDDVRQLTDEIKKQNEALATNAERMNLRAKRDLEKLTIRRGRVDNDLTDARSRLSFVEQQGPNRPGDTAFVQKLADARRAVRDLEASRSALDKSIADAKADRLASARDLAGEAANRATDPLARIRYEYEGANGLIEQAKKRATAEEVVNGTLFRRIALLREQQQKATEAAQRAQAASRKTGNNNQIGREIGIAEATQIAASIGGRVTSGLRSREKQEQLYADKLAGRHQGPVAKPGTSDHERGQAIDIAFAPGLTVAKIREAFQKEGVAIKQLLVERDQKVFHVAFGSKGKSAETIARSEETQRQKEIRDTEAFASLKERAQQQLLDTYRGQVTSVSQAAELDVSAVLLERQRLDEAAQAGVLQKRWTQAKADELKQLYAGNAAFKVLAIRDQEAAALAQRKLDIERSDADRQIAMLELQGDLAVTAADRRRIALEILAAEERIATATLKAAIAAEKDPERKAVLERQLGDVPTIFAGKREQTERQNDDPLQAYGRNLIAATSDMDTALKQVKVDGLRELEDGLVGIVTGTESVASAFKRMALSIIADLARIAIQKAIVNAVGSSFFGLADGGKVADVPGYANGGIPFVDQGIIRGAGDGRSDSILALVDGRKPIRVSNGEAIVNERGVRKHWALIDAINKDQLPTYATGGFVGTMPQLPNVRAASAALATGNAQQAGGTISVRVALSDDLHATIDNRAAGVAVQVVRASAPELIETASTATIARLSTPGM